MSSENMAEDSNDEICSFSSMCLDERLLKAIEDLKWTKPTLIQERAIPLALDGKDILARACTGSGKTAAFAIPIINKILERKRITNKQSIRSLILAPTKELSAQLHQHLCKLCAYCSREVRSIDLSVQCETEAHKSVLSTLPDIIIGTPSRVLCQISAKHMDLKKSLEFLVVDEADLLLSFGYEDEMKEILKSIPETYQAFLTSATFNENVKTMKNLILHNPVILKLQEARLPSATQLTQYHIQCTEVDKFVLLYALLKLRLVKGRTIIFVNTVDRCYRLKLFLEQFGINSCILNSEMPTNSRCHVVQQYNEGKYDIVISADETNNKRDAETKPLSKYRRARDPESGIARGIDFHQVTNVVNFDFPKTVDEYVHRVGRTARGWNEGTALSFATPQENKIFNKIRSQLSTETGEDLFKPYQFRMEELDGFKYRARDAYKAVTSTAVREARLADIKTEIMKSEKLKTYFAKNPQDFKLLRHDQELHTVKVQPHLKHVPNYIVPVALRGANYSAPLKSKNRKRKFDETKNNKRMTLNQKKFVKRKNDPLQSFDI